MSEPADAALDPAEHGAATEPCTCDHDHDGLKDRLRHAAWRYGGSWAAVTGLIATSTTCPYCGNPGCAVGIGQAAGIGAITSGVLWLVNRFKKKRAQDGPESSDEDQRANRPGS